VYLPDPEQHELLGRPTAWVGAYIEEHATFPNGTNDDQVDATSQALTRMRGTLVTTASYE
jgi:phage terminase large subunit-like protein